MSLNPEAREIVDLVLEALDIPYAVTTGNEKIRKPILDARLIHLLFTLQMLPITADPAWWMTNLRNKLAELPAVGYVTDIQACERLAQGATWTEAVTLDQPEAGS